VACPISAITTISRPPREPQADPDPGPDFTEQRFRWLLRLAKRRYRFEPFGTNCTEPHILWRHDIDYSLERALRIASIEAEEGVQATYFLLVTCRYYSLLEREARRSAQRILALGHRIGLHFDPLVYEGEARPMEDAIHHERELLEGIVAAPVAVMSFHNPAQAGVLDVTRHELGGLLNVYGGRIRSDYLYGSDSFGVWRFTPMQQVLEEARHPRLHLLTHPVWWTEVPASPRAKIARAIAERSRFLQQTYDDLLRDSDMWDTISAQDKS
jgi:hypothetical protein